MSPSERSESWSVELTASDDAATDTCLYLPPKALEGVELPKRLLVRGPNGHPAVVGSTRSGGADDQWVIGVSPALLTKVAPGREGELRVSAKLQRASWGDVWIHTDNETIGKVVTAVLGALAAIAVGVVAFLTRKVSMEVAVAVGVVAVLFAVMRAGTDVRDALKPKCR